MKIFNYILVLLLISISTTAISMTPPELTSPTDQAENIPKTTTLQWMDTGSSYDVEVYECNPDYNYIGQLGLGGYGLDISNPNVISFDKDFSGLTYNASTSTFFGVNNKPTFVVELDNGGSVVRKIDLIGFLDTEGIVWIEGNQFLVLEEGRKRIVNVNIGAANQILYSDVSYVELDIICYDDDNNPSDDDSNKCLEGISYNPLTNEVIIIKEEKPGGIYTFPLPVNFSNNTITPNIPFNVENLFNINALGAGADLAGLHHLALTNGLNEIAVSDHILILSQKNKKLVECDLSGNVYGTLNLNGLAQPEGVSMDNQGNIYIASEDDGFHRFTNPNLDLTPFNTSTSVFSNNAVSGTSLTIPEGVLDADTEYCWRVKNNDTELWSAYSSFSTANDFFADLFFADCGTLNQNGNTITISGTRIKNIGTASATSVKVGWYISTDNNINTNDNLIDTRNTSVININNNYTFPDITLNLNSIPSGNYYVGAIIDYENSLEESDETNNTDCVSGLITVVEAKPDLVVTNCGTITPDGENININGIVLENIGTASAGIHRIGYYFSTDTNIDANDYFSEPAYIWSALGPGGSRTISLAIDISDTVIEIPAGTYYVGAIADYQNVIPELNKDNNTCYIPATYTVTSGCKLPEAHNYNPNFNNNDPSQCETCTDGIQNGDETGIDCGGVKCRPCCNELPPPVLTDYELIDCSNGNADRVQFKLNDVHPTATYDVYYTTDYTDWQPATPNGLQISGSTAIWNDCVGPERNAAAYRVHRTCDSDSDGLPDAFEVLSVGTDPNEMDSDADGIPDSAEDSDCDGFTNIDEYTNPFMGVTSNCNNNCRYKDSLRLVDFYDSTNGPNWTTKWDLTQPMTTWLGVTLNANGCVESVVIGSNKISGTLPASIGELSEMKRFALGGNEIGGNIPSSIGQLKKLTNLGLGGNEFTGGIPPQIGDMTSLQQLWLSGNKNLGGSIPAKLGQLTNLTHLVLNDCGLTGSLPKELAGQTSIYYWRIFNNDLSGCYPPELAVICSRLRPGYNGDDKISDGTNLDSWETFCTKGVGACIESDNCRERDSLALVQFYHSTNGPNWTTKWNLTQPMTTWLGVTLNVDGCVESVVIGSNKISGTLPASIGELSEMKRFALGGNEIGGNIPSSIGQLKKLTNLGLGGNEFTGGIPSEIGDMTSLEQLWLAGNINLGGNIPPNLGNLTNLTHLVLNNCELTGSLPKELAGQSSIYYWRLYDNDLTGCYPPELAVICSRLRPGFNGDDKISDGNNLSSWESFCANQSGGCKTGTKVGASYISNYKIYPNPIQNGTTLHLEFDSQTDSQNATLSIYNITGQLVQSENLTTQNGQNQFTTTLEKYAAGVYFVKLQSGTYIGTQKLIIQ